MIYFVFLRMPDETIEEVINEFAPEPSVNIVFKEKIHGGIMILYMDKEVDDLYMAFAKKRFGEYKIDYSSFHGDAFIF